MSLLPLSPDELLTTTRAVRKRLDFDRPVERSVIEECLQIAIQAPTGSNLQRWHFVVVTDQAKRRAIAELYRKSWANYLTSPTAATNLRFDDPTRDKVQQRVGESAQYLADHLEHAWGGSTGSRRTRRPGRGARSCRPSGASCWPRAPAASARP